MLTVGASEAKTRLSSLLKRVAAGEHVVITMHGVPIATLVPAASGAKSNPQLAIRRLRELSRHATLGGVSVKESVAEGRKYRRYDSP
jgi:prevent-host-death family protein